MQSDLNNDISSYNTPFQQDSAFMPCYNSNNFILENYNYNNSVPKTVEHRHFDFYEIHFLLSGKMKYLVEGKTFKLKPGYIVLINNTQLHLPISDEGKTYERTIISINPDYIIQKSTPETDLTTCFKSCSQEGYIILLPNPKTLNRIHNILNKINKTDNSHVYGSEILKELYVIELMVFINRAYTEVHEKKLDIDIEYNEKITNVLRYINAKLSNDLSLDTLAAKFYISKYHLLREFKKHVGYTIYQYIKLKRLIMAQTLLKQGISITEVCLRCGFNNYSSFIRLFKSEFGITPKKYYQRYMRQ